MEVMFERLPATSHHALTDDARSSAGLRERSNRLWMDFGFGIRGAMPTDPLRRPDFVRIRSGGQQ
jgi:hypothetical protein